MKIVVAETVTHFHEVEMSDELDVETVIEMANSLKNKCDTGYEAIQTVLQAYKNENSNAFDFTIVPNACGPRCECLEYEYSMDY